MHINDKSIKYFQNKILAWYNINGRKFPWRKKSISNYQKVIAEVLLQRTKAETVSKFFNIFISQYPNWKTLAQATKSDIEKSLTPIGLQKQRATRLLKLAIEMDKRNGRFPKNYEELKKISFLGQYISNSIMLLIHNIPMPLLDVNMARVLERFFGPRKLADIRYDPYLQELSLKVVNHRDAQKINWAILDFAQLICKANKPKCNICIIKNVCLYEIIK
jgi:A/G-specific adenine glycosylase